MNKDNVKFSIAVTGGGTLGPANILAKGGASSWLYEVVTPYHTKALNAFLGHVPESYCSSTTAGQMASKARSRIEDLFSDDEAYPVGVGITCSLGKAGGEREGRVHKFYMVIDSPELKTWLAWENPEPSFTRLDEEKSIGEFINLVIGAFRDCLDYGFSESNIDGSYLVKRILNKDKLKSLRNVFLDDEPIRGFVADNSSEVMNVYEKLCKEYCVGYPFQRDGNPVFSDKKLVVIPGSFNPLHEGHEGIYNYCQERFPEQKPVFEISTNNYSKPNLDPFSFVERAGGMEGYPFFASNAATFEEKTQYLEDLGFLDIVFAVGADTWNRIDTDELIHMSENVEFLIFEREGFPPADMSDQREHLGEIASYSTPNISSTAIRNEENL